MSDDLQRAMVFVTNRIPTVALRPLTTCDADIIAGWAGDPDFRFAAGWAAHGSRSEVAEFHREVILRPPAGLLRLGAVAEGLLVGYVDLHGEERDRRELGFVIGGRDNWNRGYGLAAAGAGIRLGFEQLDLREIWAEALDANNAAIRILERLDMLETGAGEPAIYLGVPTYFRRFALTRSRWERERQSARGGGP